MKANRSDFAAFLSRLGSHIHDFPYIWILIGLLVLSSAIAVLFPSQWRLSVTITGISLVLMMLLLLSKPLNAVYGLIGSSGSIRLFFGNFLLITLVFAGIYYFGFFHNAGITYDLNQPHIDFRMFAGTDKVDSTRVFEKKDTVVVEYQRDSSVFHDSLIHCSVEELKYQKISFEAVWKSTILTTLTQSPTELFGIATTYNSSMETANVVIDRQKGQLLHWILIFHIIISWIFFGVFISLLYNKFRYES